MYAMSTSNPDQIPAASRNAVPGRSSFTPIGSSGQLSTPVWARSSSTDGGPPTSDRARVSPAASTSARPSAPSRTAARSKRRRGSSAIGTGGGGSPGNVAGGGDGGSPGSADGGVDGGGGGGDASSAG